MSSRQVIKNLKGFRDFLPKEAAKRNWLRGRLIEIVEKWGYEPLETPTLEPLALFTGQIGEDEKLFFSFKDQGKRKVALRYDQTVPTCRVIGQYYNQLVFPWRRYQIQSAFRAEKPQKGRYREFTQFDLDIFGVASPLADAEIMAVNLDIYQQLGFKKVKILVNNRDLMQGIPYPAIAAIDKLKRIGKDRVIEEMIAKGIEEEQAKKYFDQVKKIQPDETIKIIFDYLQKSGYGPEHYQFEPTLARSFSYSQGPIWEIVIPEYAAGAVGGGERYDNLVEKISGQKIPATGIALGFDRTLEALEICGLLPQMKTDSRVLVTVFAPELHEKSIDLGKKLRDKKIKTEVYPDPMVKLDKQLKYADKKSLEWVAVIGPNEIENRTVSLKNLKTRTQVTVAQEAVVEIINGSST
jgi:histidyl-tRNA synthetase